MTCISHKHAVIVLLQTKSVEKQHPTEDRICFQMLCRLRIQTSIQFVDKNEKKLINRGKQVRFFLSTFQGDSKFVNI